MVRQTVVEFGGNTAHLWQTVVRNVREIMMLNVVSEIIDEEIERAVVTACCLAFGEEIVLGDEVASQRVKAQTQKGSNQKVG